jgi:hypothetical protein
LRSLLDVSYSRLLRWRSRTIPTSTLRTPPIPKAEKKATEADQPAAEAKDKAASEKKPKNTVRILPLKATKMM